MANDTSYRAKIAGQLLGTTPSSLGFYFQVYDSLIARNDIHVLQIEEPDPDSGPPTAITHDDILLAAQVLRDDPALTLDRAITQLGVLLNTGYGRKQLEISIQISVRAMFMLDCTGSWHTWHSHERFVDFVSRCFSKIPAVAGPVKAAIESRSAIKAWKLRARCNISFKGTDDLACHLLLDQSHPDGPTLYIFHCTAFLKAQLDHLQQKKFEKEDRVLACLEKGCLPPRLLAETLHSIQAILFHFDDHRSSRILERLIAKSGFDEDCSQPEGYKIFDDADNLEYHYWGDRLAALHAFVLDRPPRNRFERWVKWQTSESNAFAVALAALFISIAVGILSLGVAAFQSWVAWKAWKDPVASDDTEVVAALDKLAELIRQQRLR